MTVTVVTATLDVIIFSSLSLKEKRKKDKRIKNKKNLNKKRKIEKKQVYHRSLILTIIV